MNIAIVSPRQFSYSETFIQAHKRLKGNIYFYYGGTIPKYLEGRGPLESNTGTAIRWARKVKRRITGEKRPIEELAFLKSLRKNSIDVVFAEYGTTGADLVKICQSGNIPLITMFHGYDASIKDVIHKYQSKYSELFKYARKIIVVSEVMKERLVMLGCPPEEIIKSIYGPDEKFLKVDPAFSEKESFVAIGRFVDKKAPYYTILAVKKVVERFPNVKLYFAGDGILHETVKNLVRFYHLENNIILLGAISPDEFILLLSKVIGFLQHSVTVSDGDMEGSPVAIIEASAAGIPVIATRHAGIPEIIQDGITGFLINEHDVESMALYMVKLLENPDLAKKMGKLGKDHIGKDFTIENHLNIINSAIKDLI